LLSQGVPMILGGDEIGRSQQGNNNAYAQDNEISWYDWEHADPGLLGYVQGLIQLRQNHPVFRRRRWFMGRAIYGEQVTDIAWFVPSGTLMDDDDWREGYARAIGMFLSGDDLGVDQRGERITDSSFYLMLNAAAEPITFNLPEKRWGDKWRVVLDSNRGDPPQLSPALPISAVLPEAAIANSAEPPNDAHRVPGEIVRAGAQIELASRSIVLLERVG